MVFTQINEVTHIVCGYLLFIFIIALLENLSNYLILSVIEHSRALDLNSSTYQMIEQLPDDILQQTIDVVYSQIEILN